MQHLSWTKDKTSTYLPCNTPSWASYPCPCHKTPSSFWKCEQTSPFFDLDVCCCKHPPERGELLGRFGAGPILRCQAVMLKASSWCHRQEASCSVGTRAGGIYDMGLKTCSVSRILVFLHVHAPINTNRNHGTTHVLWDGSNILGLCWSDRGSIWAAKTRAGNEEKG